ncbi:DNA repair and recombination protein RAD26 [Smittium culicis]|uniref:DNA repair and recombination protein RAD26 n=1 Tax=Smittium culicis TaxID=133412 RepID=A0A1R1X279_9FUNG|nr:DNA repair and recombination protein RAD26 [Smittium culicis]
MNSDSPNNKHSPNDTPLQNEIDLLSSINTNFDSYNNDIFLTSDLPTNQKYDIEHSSPSSAVNDLGHENHQPQNPNTPPALKHLKNSLENYQPSKIEKQHQLSFASNIVPQRKAALKSLVSIKKLSDFSSISNSNYDQTSTKTLSDSINSTDYSLSDSSLTSFHSSDIAPLSSPNSLKNSKPKKQTKKNLHNRKLNRKDDDGSLVYYFNRLNKFKLNRFRSRLNSPNLSLDEIHKNPSLSIEFDHEEYKSDPNFNDHALYLPKDLRNTLSEQSLFLNSSSTSEIPLLVPHSIWSNLLDYQKSGLQWLYKLHSLNTGGILGDEMGLGKTVQIVSFLASVYHSHLLPYPSKPSKFKNNIPSYTSSFNTVNNIDFNPVNITASPDSNFHVTPQLPSLLVCPATLISHWINEFHKWATPLRIVVLHSSGSGYRIYNSLNSKNNNSAKYSEPDSPLSSEYGPQSKSSRKFKYSKSSSKKNNQKFHNSTNDFDLSGFDSEDYWEHDVYGWRTRRKKSYYSHKKLSKKLDSNKSTHNDSSLNLLVDHIINPPAIEIQKKIHKHDFKTSSLPNQHTTGFYCEDSNSDYDSCDSNIKLDDGEFSKKNINLSKIKNTCTVFITTYAGLSNNKGNILNVKWGYVILDEGHIIKNPLTDASLMAKKLKTNHKILISGTPIQNNLLELWNLFDFVYPNLLGSQQQFSKQFEEPITNSKNLKNLKSKKSDYYTTSSTSKSFKNLTRKNNLLQPANKSGPENLDTVYNTMVELRSIISPFLLRREKSNVTKSLNQVSELVLVCNLTKIQINMYKNFITGGTIQSILEGKTHVLLGIDYVRKIANHPDLIKSKNESSFEVGSLHVNHKNFDGYSSSNSDSNTSYVNSKSYTKNRTANKLGRSDKRSRADDQIFTDASDCRDSNPNQASIDNIKNKFLSNFSDKQGENDNSSIGTNEDIQDSDSYCQPCEIINKSGKLQVLFSLLDLFYNNSNKRSTTKFPEKSTCTPPKNISNPNLNFQSINSDTKFSTPSFDTEIDSLPNKVLVFVQTRQMLDIIESSIIYPHTCKKYSHITKPFKFLRMDGTTPIQNRQNLVDTFNNFNLPPSEFSSNKNRQKKSNSSKNADSSTDNSYYIFLLTTKVGGLGLNLTSANKVVIFDPDWNPSLDNQAKLRCVRIGQKRHVTIIRLIANKTIETNIYYKQLYKQLLFLNILKNPNEFLKNQYSFYSQTIGDLFGFDSMADIGKNLDAKYLADKKSDQDHADFAENDIVGTGSELNGASPNDSSNNSSFSLTNNKYLPITDHIENSVKPKHIINDVGTNSSQVYIDEYDKMPSTNQNSSVDNSSEHKNNFRNSFLGGEEGSLVDIESNSADSSSSNILKNLSKIQDQNNNAMSNISPIKSESSFKQSFSGYEIDSQRLENCSNNNLSDADIKIEHLEKSNESCAPNSMNSYSILSCEPKYENSLEISEIRNSIKNVSRIDEYTSDDDKLIIRDNVDSGKNKQMNEKSEDLVLFDLLKIANIDKTICQESVFKSGHLYNDETSEIDFGDAMKTNDRNPSYKPNSNYSGKLFSGSANKFEFTAGNNKPGTSSSKSILSNLIKLKPSRNQNSDDQSGYVRDLFGDKINLGDKGPINYSKVSIPKNYSNVKSLSLTNQRKIQRESEFLSNLDTFSLGRDRTDVGRTHNQQSFAALSNSKRKLLEDTPNFKNSSRQVIPSNKTHLLGRNANSMPEKRLKLDSDLVNYRNVNDARSKLDSSRSTHISNRPRFNYTSTSGLRQTGHNKRVGYNLNDKNTGLSNENVSNGQQNEIVNFLKAKPMQAANQQDLLDKFCENKTDLFAVKEFLQSLEVVASKTKLFNPQANNGFPSVSSLQNSSYKHISVARTGTNTSVGFSALGSKPKLTGLGSLSLGKQVSIWTLRDKFK